jgi:hypothetical protein
MPESVDPQAREVESEGGPSREAQLLSGRAVWGRILGALGRLSACSFLLAVLLWDLSGGCASGSSMCPLSDSSVGAVSPMGSSVLMTNDKENVTFSFNDAEAAFGAALPVDGIQV